MFLETYYIIMNSTEILIQEITKEISLYIPIALLIFDSCRCLCNFIIFTSEELKTNSCALYFLCTAIIELPTFSFDLISRLANNRFGSTLFSTNKIYCNIRSYLIITLLALITYMILLATIDRFMSTRNEVRYRSCSQLKVAYRITPVMIIIVIVSFSHMLIFFDFYPSCIAQPENYAIFFIVFI
jgi:hypothetical protein